jgi:hypothetical protein
MHQCADVAGKIMLPSLHDNYLVAYEVRCEAREIKLYARRTADGRGRAVVFSDVEAYDFQNDAFGNIISSLEEVSAERLIAEFSSQIAESYRLAGAPGPWAADLASAPQVLAAKGVCGFILSSSYGFSGWVLAKEASVTQLD